MSLACSGIMSIRKSLTLVSNDNFFLVTLRSNIRAAIVCAKTSGGNKSRHMTQVHEDYVKECKKLGRVKIEWVPSKEQLADIFRKALCYKTHTSIRNQLLNYEQP